MDPRPAEAVSADWKPFGNTLSDWLASAKPAVATRGHSGAHQAPQSESAPAPAKTTTQPTLAMQNSSGAPSAIVKPALESGSPRLALTDWQPLEDAMKNWHVGEKLPEPPATRIENITRSAPTIIAVEVKPVQISEIAPTSLTEARIAEPAHEPVQAGPVTAETRVESTVSADGPAAKTAPVIAMRDEPVRPVESVFRKNAVAFAAILAAGTAAIFCFFNWFRTIARPDTEEPVALSLTPEDDLQPDRPQLDAAAIESAALKALLDSVPATPTATRRQAATTARLPEASTSRNASSKLAMHGQAA
jgi:hypothetical protein